MHKNALDKTDARVVTNLIKCIDTKSVVRAFEIFRLFNDSFVCQFLVFVCWSLHFVCPIRSFVHLFICWFVRLYIGSFVRFLLSFFIYTQYLTLLLGLQTHASPH